MTQTTPRSLNLEAIRDFVDRTTSPEMRADVQDAATSLMGTKQKFLKIVCRLCGWDDWLTELEAADGDMFSRGMNLDALIAQHPDWVRGPKT